MQKPLKDRIKVIESNENFTVSIIDGTIRVRELSKEVRASKASFWHRRSMKTLAIISFYCFFILCNFFSIFLAKNVLQVIFINALFANYFLMVPIVVICSLKVSKEIFQKKVWKANLTEDIANIKNIFLCTIKTKILKKYYQRNSIEISWI